MKFKIICVVVIAASLALILSLAWTGKDQASAPQAPKVSMETLKDVARGNPVQPGDVVIVPDEKMQKKIEDGVLEPVAPQVEAQPVVTPEERQTRMEEKAARIEQERQSPKDEVDFVLSAVDNSDSFAKLPYRQKLSAVSIALKLNEEQEVMLASYLEASERFKQDPANAKFAMIIRDAGTRVENTIGKTTSNPSIKDISAMVDIMALELKEVRALKDVFINSLTPEQKQKFESLAIAESL